MVSAIRLMGAGCILFACAMLGYLTVRRMRQRVKTLAYLEQFLTTLSDEINFSLEPLPNILASLAEEELGEVRVFAAYLAHELKNRDNATLREVWLAGLDKYRRQMGLSDTTMRILQSLGKKLGTMSREIEIGNLSIAIAGVQEEAKRAQALCDKNSKMYQSLSILSGVLLVIVLI